MGVTTIIRIERNQVEPHGRTIRKLAEALSIAPGRWRKNGGLIMPSANGHGQKRAILYARVSTDEQARSGYSLARQLEGERLRRPRGLRGPRGGTGRRPERRKP